jgi:quercetin dioxygenase-like cupin family protein
MTRPCGFDYDRDCQWISIGGRFWLDGKSKEVREDQMRRPVMMIAIALVAGSFATAASAQNPAAAPSGPAYSKKFFTTALEKDPSRVVQMQMQLHLPNRPGNGFHTHNGDQWEAVIEGEITYTVKGQPPQVLKVGDSVYIPRGTIHRNENKSDAPARTVELLIMDKDKPQNNPVPTD